MLFLRICLFAAFESCFETIFTQLGAMWLVLIAAAFGLRFLALENHVVELWVAERWLDHPGVSALVELLTTKAFTERVAHFGGYDLTHCGESVDVT